jgi:hypothetical protein
MSRYFFDVKNGDRLIDPSGLDCRDDQEARKQAIQIAMEAPHGWRPSGGHPEQRQTGNREGPRKTEWEGGRIGRRVPSTGERSVLSEDPFAAHDGPAQSGTIMHGVRVVRRRRHEDSDRSSRNGLGAV